MPEAYLPPSSHTTEHSSTPRNPVRGGTADPLRHGAARDRGRQGPSMPRGRAISPANSPHSDERDRAWFMIRFMGHYFPVALPRPRDGQPSSPRQQQQQRTPGRVAKVLAPAIVRAADGLSRWTTRVLGVEATAGREQITEKE